ncbi:hypothetical protein [Caballeronia sp. AZ7_KS35]|uniref:hypothetical protein n=1 Tax=Caballeronia sp. AZ7_KS35 TaxID=2921762 RepID=UPI002029299C|nr:hypothetical protein [Caballeronia sp. AZ7_KS35]
MLPVSHMFAAFPNLVSAGDLLDREESAENSAQAEPAPICIACGVRQSDDGFLPCGHDTI